MNYHDIQHDTMLQGEGLRVAIFFSGCDKEPKCRGCHNAIAWDKNSGIPFDVNAKLELYQELAKPHIQGITILGGEPLASYNREGVTELCKNIKKMFSEKDIWLYTGYTYEDVKDLEVMNYVDVLVDGEFIEELADENYPWAGSTNQRVIRLMRLKNDISMSTNTVSTNTTVSTLST